MTTSPKVWKGTTLALAALALVATGARAQALEDPRAPRGPNILLESPGEHFGEAVSLEYQRALASWLGLTAGLSVWSFHPIFFRSRELELTAVDPEFGSRFHFIGDAPEGVWLGPLVSNGYRISRADGPVSRLWSSSVGATIGYNFSSLRHLSFQVGAGGGLRDDGDQLVLSPQVRFGVGAF